MQLLKSPHYLQPSLQRKEQLLRKLVFNEVSSHPLLCLPPLLTAVLRGKRQLIMSTDEAMSHSMAKWHSLDLYGQAHISGLVQVALQALQLSEVFLVS